MLQVSGLFDHIVVDAIDDASTAPTTDGAQALVLQVNSPRCRRRPRRDGGAARAHRRRPAPDRRLGRAVRRPPVRDAGPDPRRRRRHRHGARGAGRATSACRSSPPTPTVDFGAAESTRCATGRSGSSDARGSTCSSSASPTRASRRSPTCSTRSTGTRRTASCSRRPRTVLDDGTVRRDTTTTVRFSKLGAGRPAVPHRRQPGRRLPAVPRRAGAAGVRVLHRRRRHRRRRRRGAPRPGLHRPGRAAGPRLGGRPARRRRCSRSPSTCRSASPGSGPVSASCSRSSAACWLFEPLPGSTLRPSWITLIAGIGGIVLAFIVGMPSMVRTRFATPTIGREWMIGEIGEVVETVDPDGVVRSATARWRARTNRATPVERRRAGAGRRHRRRHAGGRAAGGRRPRLPRTLRP